MKFQGLRQFLDFGNDEKTSEPYSGANDHTHAPKVGSRVTSLMDELDRLQVELSQANQRVVELESIADEDPLVPVLNRRSFMRELERTIAYVARYKTRVSVIFCDLDGFKDVNDRYGHGAGDAALGFFARFLIAKVRKSDLVGRVGGDEFAVILHRADAVAAAEKADRLMNDLAGSHFSHNGEPIALNVSAGATEIRTEDTAALVMERVDKAMYACKANNKAERTSAATSVQ